MARRKKRAELRLEETRAALKEAGGGSTTRTLFAMVNANKKLGRLDSAVEKYQQQAEDIERRKFELREEEERVLAALRKTVRERDNEKERLAYLASQSAQEAGRSVHMYTGTRDAVEAFRRLAQETQQFQLVPQVDLLYRMALTLDPGEYKEEEDPLLLGVDVSEEDQSDVSSSASIDSMDSVREEARGKKRQLDRFEERWETAEDREGGEVEQKVGSGAGPREEEITVPRPTAATCTDLGAETRRAERALKENMAILEATVDANRQIEAQERMQSQQDKEAAVLQAAREYEARLQGAEIGRWKAGPPRPPPLNPRLDIAAAKLRAATPSEGESSGSDMEVEGEGRGKKAKGRSRREHSRTPRGRMLDKVD